MKTIFPKASFVILFLFFSPTIFAQTNLEKPDSSVKELMTYVEEMPEFPGGLDSMYSFIVKNMVYPKDMQKQNKEARVISTFVITDEGKITQVEVVNQVPEPFAKESLRLIKSMPDWKPGKQNGKNVNVKFTLPLRFKLN
jgi:TonB family protein